MINTSKGAAALSLAASRAAAPLSSLPRISSIKTRPELNISPFKNTIGTAITWRWFTSSWYSAPSITTTLTRGL